MEEKNKEITSEVLEKLSQPITPKWRVLTPIMGGKKALVVPYIDSRQVQQRLDEVVGKMNWQNTYDATTGTSSLGIRVGDGWIYKTDVGTESKTEKEKGMASDALKRAAVLWGIGRDIYEIGQKQIDYDSAAKITKTPSGTPLYGNSLSIYMNGLSESMGLLMQIWKLNPDKQTDDEFKELMAALKKYL